MHFFIIKEYGFGWIPVFLDTVGNEYNAPYLKAHKVRCIHIFPHYSVNTSNIKSINYNINKIFTRIYI